MKEHESFLKMIGFDDSGEISLESSLVGEDPHTDLSTTWEETENTEHDHEAESFPIENALEEVYEKTELTFTEEVTTADVDAVAEEPLQETWDEYGGQNHQVEDQQWEPVEEDSVLDEPTRPADLNSQTAVYSNEEVDQVTARIKEEMSEEDRLLEGLEEAEESRATDVFAKSYRSDSRKTRALGAESFIEAEESAEPSSEEWPEADEIPSIEASVSSEDQPWEEPNASSGLLRSTSPSRQTLPFAYEKSKGHRLLVIEGPVQEKEIFLELLPLSFGRDPKNNVVLDDSNVSRFHAEVRDIEGQIKIVDLGSTNGIKVNGALVTEQTLQDHDIVQIGDSLFEMLFEGSQSKGVEAARETYIQEGSPQKLRSKNNKMRRWAAVIFVLAGILFAYQNRNIFIGKVQEKGQAVALSKAGDALEEFKAELEVKFDQPIEDLPDDKLREGFVQKLENYPFLPDSVKAQLQQLPTTLLRLFLEDPNLLADYAQSGGNEENLKVAVRSKLAERMRTGQLSEALALVELLLMADSENEELLAMKQDIQAKLQIVPNHSGDEISEEDRQKFFAYMQNFQEQTEKLIDQGELEAARQFAEVVKEKTLELVRKQPAFGVLAESAVAEWSSKIAFLDQQIQERQARKEEVNAILAEANKKIDSIKRDMDAGRVYEASLAVEEFINQYPDHPRVDEVRQYGAEIQQAIQISFQSMNSKIETYVKTENYKVAWDSLYRFLDLMPGYDPAMTLREDLLEQTRMRAVQYYNQARVFEFEADDLIAVEQYYKKVLETADPRGELAKKAERRYADVRRKTIQ